MKFLFKILCFSILEFPFGSFFIFLINLLRFFPFLQGCPIVGIQLFIVFSYGLCSSVVLVIVSPFSFFILFIWVIYLFFLVSLSRIWSILFTLSKKQLLVLLIFFYCFLNIFYLFPLIFIISFLLLNLGFVCSSFSNYFRR